VPKHEEHDEHVNHEAWVIPYADMLTLLMAIFLVMWAIGRTDQDKFQKVAAGFHKIITGKEMVVDPGIKTSSGDSIIDGSNVFIADKVVGALFAQNQRAQAAQALAIERAQQTAAEKEQTELKAVEDQIKQTAEAAGFGAAVNFTLNERGLVVTLVTDQVLFDPGQAAIRSAGFPILDTLVAPLKTLGKPVRIEGHTDSSPINTPIYPSNWELSGARASSVLRYLVSKGVPQDLLSQAGYADTKPIADNATPEGRSKNRRVEIVIQADARDAAAALGLPSGIDTSAGAVATSTAGDTSSAGDLTSAPTAADTVTTGASAGN